MLEKLREYLTEGKDSNRLAPHQPADPRRIQNNIRQRPGLRVVADEELPAVAAEFERGAVHAEGQFPWDSAAWQGRVF